MAASATLRIQLDIPNLPEQLNRTYEFTIFSTFELRTATDTATPTGTKRDVIDLEIAPSPPKKVAKVGVPDEFSTPSKKVTKEPTSPELQHVTKLAECDALQPAAENPPDLMSWSADDLIKFFLDKAGVPEAPSPSAASGSDDHDDSTITADAVRAVDVYTASEMLWQQHCPDRVGIGCVAYA